MSDKLKKAIENLKNALNTKGNPSSSGAVNVKYTGVANPDKE